MKKYKLILLISIILLTISCGTKKKIIDESAKITKEEKEQKRMEKFVENITNNEIVFKTMQINTSGRVNFNSQSYRLKANIMVQSNEKIYISVVYLLGFEVAKILITKDSVKFLNKINSTYFSESFEQINKKFKTDFDYSIIENLITNKFTVYPKEDKLDYLKKFRLTEDENNFILEKQKKDSLNISYKTNKSNYKIKNINIIDLNNKIKVQLNYTDFRDINKFLFPYKIIIGTEIKQQKSNTSFSVKNLSLNKELKIKFKISEKYKRIKW